MCPSNIISLLYFQTLVGHTIILFSLMESKADQMKHTQFQRDQNNRWGPISPVSCGPWKRSMESLNPHRPIRETLLQKLCYSVLFSIVRSPMLRKRKRACPDRGGNSRAGLRSQVTSLGSRCWLLPTSPLHLVTRVQEAACRPSFPGIQPCHPFCSHSLKQAHPSPWHSRIPLPQ